MIAPSRARVAAVVLAGLALAALAMWRNRPPAGPLAVERSIRPAVMGTTSRLVAVGPPGRLDEALEAALAELQAVNERMSLYDPSSELSRFNAAPAGARIPLSPSTLEVLRFGQALAGRTGGAFDVTMRPIGTLWKEAARRGRLPTAEEKARVLERVGHGKLVVGDDWALKEVEGLEVSLDAIAKGYAVDRALAALVDRGLTGGLVEVGGDLAVFGRPAGAPAWVLGLQDPWGEGTILELEIPPGESVGVCTSGDYRRFVEIDGVRYGHVVDPRTGEPVARAPSATAIAATALAADGWATALSVLGPQEGLAAAEAEPGLEALLVEGPAGSPRLVETSGLARYRR